MNVRVNAGRLRSDLEALASFGRGPGGGITRPALGAADCAAREWLCGRMREAGLEVTVDAAANVIGRLRCRREGAQAVVIGSHLDTVPDGGVFDGALGVLAGLECARILAGAGMSLPWNVEVINFTDEEGHHNAGTFGSRAMLGQLEEGEMDRGKSVGQPPMATSLSEMGLDPGRVGDARRDPESFRAYLELHIEQGSRLETEELDIGVVTGIVGIYRYVVSIAGRANHAGTTPMDSRQDALVTAAPLFTLLPGWARARTRDMVATIGQLKLEPGAVNVIPGRCTFTVELRSLDSSHMRHVRDLVVEHACGLPGSTADTIFEKDGVALAPDLMAVIEHATRAEGLRGVRMPSGAGHDAQSFAPEVPTAMLFVPSRGGLSHCPDEWTDFDQAATGAQVLLGTILELASLDGERAGRGEL